MTRLATLCLLLAGCMDSSTETSESAQSVESANGVSLNGVSLNGVSLNGVSLNGVSLNGVSLNGVSLNGVSLNGVSLNGTTLTGVRDDGGGVLALSAIGREVLGVLSNGTTITLRIDGATALANDLWSYSVSYATDAGWLPLCGASIGALSVAGSWNTDAGVPGGGAYSAGSGLFTFACRGKTIAKCVELGYTAGRIDHLQSCVRLLRGDYCGDGTAYTKDGHQVNVYDGIGVQKDTQSWLVEAEWTPAGARCISIDRETRAFEGGLVPTCLAAGTLPVATGCGRSFRAGALLISELPNELIPTQPTSVLSTTLTRK